MMLQNEYGLVPAHLPRKAYFPKLSSFICIFPVIPKARLFVSGIWFKGQIKPSAFDMLYLCLIN